MQKKFLTPADVADLLGVSLSQIEKNPTRPLEDRIPFYKLGRSVRFDPDDVAAYLTARRQPGNAGKESKADTEISAPSQPEAAKPLSVITDGVQVTRKVRQKTISSMPVAANADKQAVSTVKLVEQTVEVQ